MSRETDVAWAAGFFEGEGCFTTSRTKRTKLETTREAKISNTDLSCLEKFQRIVGVGRVYQVKSPSKPAHHKPIWLWRSCVYNDIKFVIELLWPHLSERRREAAMKVLNAPYKGLVVEHMLPILEA